MGVGHSEHVERQDGILELVLGILTSDDRVLGVVTIGSTVYGARDAFSDIDLACILRDEARTGREELYNQVGNVAPLLCRLWIYDLYALYVFENGVRLDLDFFRPSDMRAKGWFERSNTRILHDPEGVLAEQLPLHDGPEPPAHPQYFEPGDPLLIDWWFFEFRQIVCWAKRGAQGGPRAYDKLAGAARELAEARSKLVDMRRWTLGVGGYLGAVDPECASRLAETYPHLCAEELILCTGRLLAEFERICPAYCAQAGVPYPARRVEVLHHLLEEFKQLA
jgi:hypothetical protein